MLLSERQLRRYFNLLGYRRRNTTTEPQDRDRIETAMRALCPSRGQGYRALQLDLVYAFGPQYRASRHFLAELRRQVDPESNRFRFRNRLIRRVYVSRGVGDCLHADQVRT